MPFYYQKVLTVRECGNGVNIPTDALNKKRAAYRNLAKISKRTKYNEAH